MHSGSTDGDAAARRLERSERALLARLASARTSGDAARTDGAIADLLRLLWPRVRAQAATALRLEGVRHDDLDDIAVATMIRLHVALVRERDVEVPLRALVRSSVRFEILEARRRRSELSAHEDLRDPAEMPEPPLAAVMAPLEQAEAVQVILVALTPRDRLILMERELLDLPVAVIARRQKMTPDAVEKVCSRALTRLRQNAAG